MPAAVAAAGSSNCPLALLPLQDASLNAHLAEKDRLLAASRVRVTELQQEVQRLGGKAASDPARVEAEAERLEVQVWRGPWRAWPGVERQAGRGAYTRSAQHLPHLQPTGPVPPPAPVGLYSRHPPGHHHALQAALGLLLRWGAGRRTRQPTPTLCLMHARISHSTAWPTLLCLTTLRNRLCAPQAMPRSCRCSS